MEPPRKKHRVLEPPPHLAASLGSSKDFRKKSKPSSTSSTAAELDASLLDYDSYLDAKATLTSSHALSSTASDGQATAPRYMSSIRAATNQRKLDQLAARDKILQREREAEGDAFADKESFVTGAYREQQAEARRAEEEQKRKDEAEEERRRRTGARGAGMDGFYKGFLSEEEERHRRLMEISVDPTAVAAAAAASKDGKEGGGTEGEETELDRARELNRAGANVVINDAGEVADKRQLLKGGLNVVGGNKNKNKNLNNAGGTGPDGPNNSRTSSSSAVSGFGSRNQGAGGEYARRERQTRMLEAQLQESTRRAEEEAEADRREAERKAQSKKSGAEISSAKERYLQRKREAAAAAASGTTAGAAGKG